MKKSKKRSGKKSAPSAKKQLTAIGNFPKIKIRVIGIGGGGGSIVADGAKNLNRIKFSAIDTDIRALNRIEKLVNAIFLGKNITGGLGVGGDVGLAEKIALEEKDKISKLLKGQDLVIFVSCLGGGVSSGMTPVFADISQKLGIKTFGFFTLPFKFEGQKKYQLALNSFKLIKDLLNVSICVPNENIFKAIDFLKEAGAKTQTDVRARKNLKILSKPQDLSLRESLSLINEILIKNLEELVSIIYDPGLVNIDFADLKSTLSVKKRTAFLNTIEAKGENKVKETIHKLTFNPLLPYDLTAERILFNITGGQDLKMLEVEEIGRAVAKLNPNAKIIFGVSKRANFSDKIKTTLIAVGGEKQEKKKRIQKETKKNEEKKETKQIKKERRKIEKKKTKEKKENGDSKLKKKPVSNKSEKKEKIKKIDIEIKDPAPKKKIEEDSQKKNPSRKSAIEIKEEQEIRELERLAEERELEIPSFLRKKTS